MRSLNEPDYDTIKDTISISDVLSRYVTVPNRSKYRIPCPIHQGDNYNFGVDNTKGLFNCFSCGAGGDVIKLYALLENITNGEAARRLSFEFSVKTGEHRTLRKVFNEARSYTTHQALSEVELPESKPLEAYRRFSREAIDHFELRLHEDGVLIPFKDTEGRVIGWSIRQVNKLPKYKNMTDLKKDFLYGLWENRRDITEAKTVYICEGQFDVVRMWDTGFRNVVSTLGATMSFQQANILTHWVSKIIILYDGDEKGRAGAKTIKDKFAALFAIDIIDLPNGDDPDVADLKQILKNNGEIDDRMGAPRLGEGLVQ